MKVTAALVTFTLVGASFAQDLSAVVSSALSVASSYVSANDMNSIVSSGLSVASSWVSANDIDSILSSFGSELGITDSSGLDSALSRATSIFDSITGAFSSDMSMLTTSTDDASPVQSTSGISDSSGDESAAVDTITSVGGGATDWSTSTAAVVGTFFLGLVAYL